MEPVQGGVSKEEIVIGEKLRRLRPIVCEKNDLLFPASSSSYYQCAINELN